MKNKQNYYTILGVEKTVNDAGLKLAYRKLSKQYHPDVNPDDPNAAAKMQEVNEAYNTLSDPKKRAEYDSGQSAGGRPAAGRGEAADMHDIFDDIFSGMKGVNIKDSQFGFGAGFGGSAGGTAKGNAKGKSEPDPKGPDSGGDICKRCNGRGRVQVFVSSGFGRIKKIQECPECGGTGKV